MNRQKVPATVLLLGLILWAGAAQAFVLFRDSNGMSVKWNLAAEGGALTYYVNKNGTSDPVGGPDVFTVFQDSFAHWVPPALPTTVAAVIYGGTTGIDTFGILPGDTAGDGFNVLLFVHNDPDLPNGTLALTLTMYDTTTGQIVETDTAFNDDYEWRTDGSGNPPATYELAPVAIHEMGHFFGLDHSFVANVGGTFDPTIACTMWPYYFGLDEETLEPDDIAGITTLYPNPAAQAAAFGAIEGRVTTWPNGPSNGLFGIHVVAISETGKVPIVSQFTSINGRYRIDGVPPGDYNLYIESPSAEGTFFTAFVASFWSSADRISEIMLYYHVKVLSASALVDGNPVFKHAALVKVSAGAAQTEINFMLGGAPSSDQMLAFDYHSNPGGCGQLAGAAGPAGPDLALWLLPAASLLVLRLRRRR